MPLPARINLVTLGVQDVARSRAFYRALGWPQGGPRDLEEVAFFALGNIALAVYRRGNLRRDLGDTSVGPSGPRDVTLALNVESAEAVEAVLAEAERAGATVLTPATRTDWGGVAGYFADPDGHAWEVAYNPGMPLDAQGLLQLG